MSAITTLGTRALEILGVEQDAADRLLALLREHPAEPLSTHGAAVAYRRCTERAVGNRSADAAQFIRDFVVQAQMNERGNFAMKPEAHHAGMEAEDTVLPPRNGPRGGEGAG